MSGLSLMLPSFLARLADPSISTVFLCGCGGGFDFVHSMSIYPELKRLGKNIIIGSYSFGDVSLLKGEVEVVYSKEISKEHGSPKLVQAKKVTSRTISSTQYCPEVKLCEFLDLKYPNYAPTPVDPSTPAVPSPSPSPPTNGPLIPHFMYAYYARDFTVPMLSEFYKQLVAKHQIDAAVIFDGGSDSLMAGDEDGLGDPIEDCVSVTTVAGLDVKVKIHISVGFGSDRFMDVNDFDSLRAVAELTRMGGFLGSVSLEPSSPGFLFYKEAVEYVYAHQSFRSVLTGLILSSSEGVFGFEPIPPKWTGKRVREGETFVWPLMGMLWAFDPVKVVERSLISRWISGCTTVKDMYTALIRERQGLKAKGKLRKVHDLPTHEAMRGVNNHFLSEWD